MSPLFRDPHPTCSRCQGRKCTADMTCDICKDWSVEQWEVFLKNVPIVDTIKITLQALTFPLRLGLPPSASASSEAGRPAPPPPPIISCGVSSSPLPTVRWERRGGDARALVTGNVGDSAVSSPSGVWVAGSSCSQESLVLAAPSSVASFASAEHDRRSHSQVAGGSTEARSRPRSTRSSLSRGGESRGERRCSCSRSGGSRAQSNESHSRSTTHSQSRGRGRSRQGSSRSPSASVRSWRSWLQSLDRYQSRQVCWRSRSDYSRSRRVRSRSSGCHEVRRDCSWSHGSCYQSRDHRLSRDRSLLSS